MNDSHSSAVSPPTLSAPLSALPSAASLAEGVEGVLRRGDGSSLRLAWGDACRYVGVSPGTVEKVWAAVAGRLTGDSAETVGLWSNPEIADFAEVSGPQARRSMRLLEAFEVTGRRRRFNRTSVTTLRSSLAGGSPVRQPGTADTATGSVADALAGVQHRLAAVYGLQVHGHGWGSEIADVLARGVDPGTLVAHLTERMGTVDTEENRVRVARYRLRELADSGNGRANRADESRGEHNGESRGETRATNDQPTPAASDADTAETPENPDSSTISGTAAVPRDSRKRRNSRATVKKNQELSRRPPSPPPDDRAPRTVAVQGRRIQGLIETARRAGLPANSDDAERWLIDAAEHGLTAWDLAYGLFDSIESAGRPTAVVRWRLVHPDGRQQIKVAAARRRRLRRAAAETRLEEWRRSRDMRVAARERAERAETLRERLGEPPAPRILGIAHWLPALETRLAEGESLSALLLSRVGELLASKDENVARQASRIVSDALAAAALPVARTAAQHSRGAAQSASPADNAARSIPADGDMAAPETESGPVTPEPDPGTDGRLFTLDGDLS